MNDDKTTATTVRVLQSAPDGMIRELNRAALVDAVLSLRTALAAAEQRADKAEATIARVRAVEWVQNPPPPIPYDVAMDRLLPRSRTLRNTRAECAADILAALNAPDAGGADGL